jgi:hypothetical protein
MMSVRQAKIVKGRLEIGFAWAAHLKSIFLQRAMYCGKELVIAYVSIDAMVSGIESDFFLKGRQMAHEVYDGQIMRAYGVRSIVGEAPKLYSPNPGYLEVWNAWDLASIIFIKPDSEGFSYASYKGIYQGYVTP